jgi:hemoglobin-like flavoprotein
MTSEQKALVQSSFAGLVPIADIAARFFYHRLFELEPRLRLLFRGDMQDQGRKLMQMIGIAVKGLDQLDALIPALRTLGSRHTGYGVREEDYETVGAALIAMLGTLLGPRFTAETREAWIAVYDLVSSMMQEPTATVFEPCASLGGD